MIALEVVNNKEQHFLVGGDEPFRVEVAVSPHDGKVVAHVYQGTALDPEQDPVGAYDGNLWAQTPSGSLPVDHMTMGSWVHGERSPQAQAGHDDEIGRIIRAASGLRSESGENPEYDRALVELVCDFIGLSTDDHRRLMEYTLGIRK